MAADARFLKIKKRYKRMGIKVLSTYRVQGNKKRFSGSPENPVIAMVGDRRIELLTSSVSRKRSTSELTAQRVDILQREVLSVNTFF